MERLKLDIQRFATSGSCTSSTISAYGVNFSVTVYWNRVSTWNDTTCGSRINWWARVNTQGSGYTRTVTGGTIRINGTSYNVATGSFGDGSSIASGNNFAIQHNNDGTKTFNITIDVEVGGSDWSYTSKDFTLDRIPRASRVDTFTLNDSQNRANIEGTFNVTYTKFASNFTDNLVIQYVIDGTFTTLKTIENYVSGTDFTLTQSEINILYNVTANVQGGGIQLRAYMKTYNGETLIGDGSGANITAYVLDADPVFSNFDVQDINSTTTMLTEGISPGTVNQVINVKGYSNISIGVSQQDRATALKGASITSYIINDTYTLTKQEFETNGFTINNCETGAFKVVARDSRGKTKDVTKYATQNIQYNPISLSERDSKIERNNNNVGTSAILTLSGTIWKGNFGAVNNAIDSSNTYYELKITDSSGNFVRGATDITPTINNDGTISFENSIKSDNPDYSWNLDDSYYVNVYVKDKLSSSSIQLVLNSAKPNISIDKKGVGINCAYDPDIGGSLQVDGQKVDPNASGIPNGSEFQFDGSTVPDGYEEVDDPYVLSTDEKKVGIFIDGKPIYRKTYYESFNASTSSVQSKTIDLNISNTNHIWVDYQNSYYITKNDYNLYTSVPIDFCNGTSASARINNYFRNANTLRYALDIYGMRAGTAYVTFLYTKTTD